MSLPSSAPPTQKKAYQALLTQEVNNKLAGLESGCGFTQLVSDGLRLEHDQYVVVELCTEGCNSRLSN